MLLSSSCFSLALLLPASCHPLLLFSSCCDLRVLLFSCPAVVPCRLVLSFFLTLSLLLACCCAPLVPLLPCHPLVLPLSFSRAPFSRCCLPALPNPVSSSCLSLVFLLSFSCFALVLLVSCAALSNPVSSSCPAFVFLSVVSGRCPPVRCPLFPLMVLLLSSRCCLCLLLPPCCAFVGV